MIYVIKRTDQGGGWLAAQGSKKSYTRHLSRARRFDTLRDAQLHRLLSEAILSFSDAIEAGYKAPGVWC